MEKNNRTAYLRKLRRYINLKKIGKVCAISAVLSLVLVGCGTKEADKEILMSTTTSVVDTGLLDYLIPIFEEDTGYTLKYDAVGTGEALSMAENGDVDVVLVHAKDSEEVFVDAGYGVERIEIMYNYFVVVGPTDEKIDTANIDALFETIIEQNLTFVSRGDDSGTDKKEKVIWENLSLDPTSNRNYLEVGQGMGATLTIANEMNGYCLTDRGTWLKMSMDSEVAMEIAIVCESDESLLNQYSVIAVDPQMHEHTNIDGANAFADWMVSDEIQELIGNYGVEEYGESLFVPNAK